jgi:hypothetical protein
LYLSHAYHGSSHDYRILKEEFELEKGAWFDEHETYVDLGFIGIRKDYTESVKIPKKKTKNNPLTTDDKEMNKNMSRTRIKVENTIGGIKRYRVLSDRLRLKSTIKYNQISGVCAGLWNFQLTP